MPAPELEQAVERVRKFVETWVDQGEWAPYIYVHSDGEIIGEIAREDLKLLVEAFENEG